MKRILLAVSLLFSAAYSQPASAVTLLSGGIEISAEDYAALKDHVVDPEVWIRKALAGKITNSRIALIRRWTPVIKADDSISSIPSKEDAFINFVLAYSAYLNRTQRDSVQASRE